MEAVRGMSRCWATAGEARQAPPESLILGRSRLWGLKPAKSSFSPWPRNCPLLRSPKSGGNSRAPRQSACMLPVSIQKRTTCSASCLHLGSPQSNEVAGSPTYLARLPSSATAIKGGSLAVMPSPMLLRIRQVLHPNLENNRPRSGE